jgi:hypothetical protein
MKEKSDKSKSTRLSRKFVIIETEFFAYNLKSQELNLDNYFTKHFPGRALVFTLTLGILSGFGTSSGSNT